MSVEIHNYEENEIEDHLSEGSILVQLLNDTNTDLYALCLFDSGSTNSLINQRSLPPFIQAKIGKMQSFTTIQGTYKKNPRDFITAI